MSLIDELRRRHVFRTIAWYAAAAWGLIQVASTIAPEFNFPDWVVRAVIIVSVAGFPVALLLAWAFDITRTGVKLTAPAAEGQAVANPMHGLISLLLAVAAGVLLGVGAVTGWQALDAPPSKPGIAVLAFDVLGQESNESLAGGLHEAVLGELAHISGLRVISRTSVLRLSVDRPDIRDIGRILDVPYVLEGSVQREGDQLRVHAQLIDAATDAHVWSQTYDRPATDLFGMQTALARDIALRLRVSLLPAEVARAGTPPTVVPAAYEWYLKGLADFGRFDQNQPNALALLRSAIASVDKALVLDPAFALAYAERARMDLQLWWWYRDFEADAARAAERALLAVTEAMRLDPDLGEAHRALGLYFYWVHLDYDRANRELTQARALLPNDSISAWILGLVRRRQNRFDEAIDLFREAYHLNPADTTARWTYEVSLVKAGQYARAEVEIADILLRFPEDVDQNLALAWMQFCRTGEAQAYWEAADAGLSSPGMENYARWQTARYEGRFEEALAIVEAVPGDDFGLISKPEALAQSYFDAGDAVRAAAAAQVVIEFIEARVKAAPDMLGVRQGLAEAYVYAGRPEEARRVAQAYLDETPLERAALDYYEARGFIARIYAMLGDPEAALELLNIVQHGPFHDCGNELRRDPAYASLLGDARFEELAAISDWK